MKICLISEYFPPENGAAANRLYNMSNALSHKDFEINIFTSFPNYPSGELNKIDSFQALM